MRPASVTKVQASNILLVDDNNHGLIARRAVLEELGYTIFTAENGEEALELYANQKFDLVVTDFRMPKMNGVELIQKIRMSDAEARIIMLSGFVEPLGLDEHSTGADVVISKSSGEVANLLRSVSRLLARRVARKPPASQKCMVQVGKTGKA
jgi:CheY-like chemotaxis protein